MIDDKSKKERMNRLRRELYSKNYQITRRKRRRISPRKSILNNNWGSTKKNTQKTFKKPKTIPKTILVISVIFFFLSALFAFQIFSGGSNVISSKNIDMNISGPISIGGGEELDLQIEIINNNNTLLQLADLIVQYPEGTISSLDSEKPLKRETYSLGTIKSKEKIKENLKAIIFGEGNSEKEIKISLEYRIEGSNAIFIKKGIYNVQISSSPINISLDLPQEANTNQEINLKVSLSSNSNSIIKNTLLNIEYPFGFQFIKSTPKPSFKDNVWSLGDFPKEGQRIINIKGLIKGQEDEEKVFRVNVGPKDSTNERKIIVAYNSILRSLSIKKPFLSATLILNGNTSDEYILNNNQDIKAEILWANNLPTRIVDGEIEVKLLGEIINKRAVFADRGFYNSSNNTIVWSKDSYSNLASIEPGDRGRVSFSFPHNSLIQNNKTIKNPQIIIELNIKGKRFSGDNIPEEIKTSVRKVIKITSDLQLTPRALYHGGPFVNRGFLPPQAEKETTYTIIWSIVNSSNDVSSVKVKASLPSYVKWLNNISPSKEKLSFNERTGEIVWNVGRVSSGAGLSLERKEVAFQVSLTPSLSQVGVAPVLISEATLVGKDTFTGTIIKNIRENLTTRLKTDTGFGPSDDVVINMIN